MAKRNHWAAIGASLALAIVTVLVYRPVLGHDFLRLDDPKSVMDNPPVKRGLTAEGIRWSFTTFHFANWTPLTWLSLMTDSHIYGWQNPRGFHRTNLFLHVAAALALFAAFCRMTQCVGRSALIAGLFALHPLHTQSVAWISERKGLLSTFFGILGLWAYAEYAKRPGWTRYLLTLLALTASLLSKQMLVTFPFLALVLDWWPLNRVSPHAPLGRGDHDRRGHSWNPWVWLALEKVPMFVLSAGFCFIAYRAQELGGALHSQPPLLERIENSIITYGVTLRQAFWPSDLAIFYPLPKVESGNGSGIFARSLFWLMALLGISAGVLLLGRSRRHLVTGWLWYLGTFVPVVGIVQVQGHGRSDRWTDVPLIGIDLMVAWTLGEWLQTAPTWRRWAILGVTVTGLFSLVACTAREIRFWGDDEQLFRRAVQVTNNNYVAHDGLGLALTKKKRYDEAIEQHLRSLSIAADFASGYHNLGLALFESGKPTEAIEAFRQAIRFAPNDPFIAGPSYSNIAVCFGRLGKEPEALNALELGYRLSPGNDVVRGNLLTMRRSIGLRLLGERKFEQAREQFQAALAIDPTDQQSGEGLRRANARE